MEKSGQRGVEEGLKVAIGEWIIVKALAGANEVEILAGICERMNRAGLSLLRASVAHDLLDPTFDAPLRGWPSRVPATRRSGEWLHVASRQPSALP